MQRHRSDDGSEALGHNWHFEHMVSDVADYGVTLIDDGQDVASTCFDLLHGSLGVNRNFFCK